MTEKRKELVALADELDSFHDCADGDVHAGNGHFRIVCVSESDDQRFALRAVLREAAEALRAQASAAPPEREAVRLREALERIPSDLFWLIGKGRLRDDEPLYGVQIKDGSETIAEAEHDNLATAISLACDELVKIPCPYCANKYTGLPNNACENCMNTGSAWPEVERKPKPVQHWGVTVRANGEEILTIESNCLSGIPNVDDYADTVRTCAEHLMSFIGGSEPRGCPIPGACACPFDKDVTLSRPPAKADAGEIDVPGKTAGGITMSPVLVPDPNSASGQRVEWKPAQPAPAPEQSVSVEELALSIYEATPAHLWMAVTRTIARALLDKYSIRSAMMTEGK